MLIYKIISIYLFIHAGILYSCAVSLVKSGREKNEPATSIIISGLAIASALFAIAGSM